jgi:hypothetical protein
LDSPAVESTSGWFTIELGSLHCRHSLHCMTLKMQ